MTVHELRYSGATDYPAKQAEDELVRLFRSLSLKPGDSLLEALNMFADHPGDFFIWERHIVLAGGAYEIVCVLKPSPRFLELLATVRARELEHSVGNILKGGGCRDASGA